MFDFSFGKLIIIFALCLIVLGPEKLPKLAAQLGRFAGQARAMARHFRSQLEQEIAAGDLKKELQAADEAIAKIAAQTPPLHAAMSEVNHAIDEHMSGMQAAVDAANKSIDVTAPDTPLDAQTNAQIASPAAQPAADVDKTTTRPAV